MGALYGAEYFPCACQYRAKTLFSILFALYSHVHDQKVRTLSKHKFTRKIIPHNVNVPLIRLVKKGYMGVTLPGKSH